MQGKAVFLDLLRNNKIFGYARQGRDGLFNIFDNKSSLPMDYKDDGENVKTMIEAIESHAAEALTDTTAFIHDDKTETSGTESTAQETSTEASSDHVGPQTLGPTVTRATPSRITLNNTSRHSLKRPNHPALQTQKAKTKEETTEAWTCTHEYGTSGLTMPSMRVVLDAKSPTVRSQNYGLVLLAVGSALEQSTRSRTPAA